MAEPATTSEFLMDRIACALERIADALETTNAANLAGVQMAPESPGRLAIIQSITDAIVGPFRDLHRRRTEQKDKA